MSHLERMVKAIMIASPWAMAVRYNDFAHCIAMSLAGATCLRRRKIEAKAVACSLVAYSDGSAVFVGHTKQSAFEFARDNCSEPLTLADFEANQASGVAAGLAQDFPDDALHAAIRAAHCGREAFIDLTVMQVTEVSRGTVRVPPSIVSFERERWPCASLPNGTHLAYGPSRRSLKDFKNHQLSGLVDDIDALMDSALGVDLDESAFMEMCLSAMKGTNEQWL